MATVFKRTRRKPIPEGAVLKTYRKRQVAEWMDGRGKQRRAPLTEDGEAILQMASHYTIEYSDENGERLRVATKISDKDGAKQYATELERKARLRKVGVIDTRQENMASEGKRPLEEHLDAFEAKMRSAGRDEKHIESTTRYIQKIAEATGIEAVGDITADAVHTFAAELSTRRSARTVGAYLTAIKSFTRWAMLSDKLPRDPLAGVKKPNPQADRQYERRMLLPEEWPWLRSAILAENVEREGMSAGERVLLYATAIQTGLRLNELRSLTRRRLFFDGERPFITCAARSTKNKRDCRQFVKARLAAELRQHIKEKDPRGGILNVPPKERAAEMLRGDLAAARERWLKKAEGDEKEYARRKESDFLLPVNHEGEHLDFHSLRHTCGGWLAMKGVHPNIIKQVMRHSTITLTLDTYGHLMPDDTAGAVDKLPDLVDPQAEDPETPGQAS